MIHSVRRVCSRRRGQHQVLRLLALTRLTDVLPIHSSVGHAADAAGRPASRQQWADARAGTPPQQMAQSEQRQDPDMTAGMLRTGWDRLLLLQAEILGLAAGLEAGRRAGRLNFRERCLRFAACK